MQSQTGAGQTAFRRRAWGEAYERFSFADQCGELGPQNLELLATSAYLVGRDEESVQTWTRAHHEYLRSGEVPKAVRCTFWMILELLSVGEWVRASGWLAAAQRLLDEGGHDCAECGLLLVLASRRQLKEGNQSAAHDCVNRALALAERFHDAELRIFGQLALALVLAKRGRAGDAAPLFDEVMVTVTTADVSPIAVGTTYCAVIEACHEVFDIERAREWTLALSRWCGSQPDLVPFRGHCLVHRAETMRLCGAWSDALEAAQQVCGSTADRQGPGSASGDVPASYPIGAAFYEMAEICRMRGDFDRSDEAYRRASEHGRSPEPGLALLRLAQGRLQMAVTAIRRALDEPRRRPDRAKVLAAAVDVGIAARDLASAGRAVQELSTLADGVDAPFLRAQAARAQAALLLAEDDSQRALAPLRRAWMEWQAIDLPYEAAYTRVLMGAAHRQVGDEEAAQLEFDAARRVFHRLGALPDIRKLEELSSVPSGQDPGPLTARERQVLRLIAGGKTNREIASALDISERTVDRHVSNILTKLDLPSRSAATAYAYEHGLV